MVKKRVVSPKKFDKLKKDNVYVYIAVKYRWYFLVLAIILMLPNFWVIPFIIAIIGIVKYLDMSKE